MRNFFVKIFSKIIRAYQVCISPLHKPCCRFYPTCSNYALEALKTHGVLKGGWYSFKRILRCNPLFKGGYDPVPAKKIRNKNFSHISCKNRVKKEEMK